MLPGRCLADGVFGMGHRVVGHVGELQDLIGGYVVLFVYKPVRPYDAKSFHR